MSESTFTASQSKITNLLLSEAESCEGNKAPKLTTLDEYPHWKDRFEIYVLGVDSHLWQMIEEGYTKPLAANGDKLRISEMTEEQRKAYDFENKAYALLSQSIPRDISHQFRMHKSAKRLWDALKQRYEGSANLKKLKAKTLRKEFDNFSHIGNESLDELLARYYHLLSELNAHGVTTTMEEKVDCLTDSLPSKWDSFVMVTRQMESFETMDINDFIQKLKEEDVVSRSRANRSTSTQNPSLYHAASPFTNVHAPMQTTMLTNQSANSSTTASEQTSQSTGQASSNSRQTSSSSSSTSANVSQSAFKTENIEKISIETTKEHFSMLSNVLLAYEDLVAGKIGNSNLTDEDYSQIDKDDMELMDIRWALANAVRRAKNFVQRTGRDISDNRNSKFGFDINKVVCYNCGEKGHFARQCTKSSKSGNQNPFASFSSGTQQHRSENSSSKASVIVSPKVDEGKVQNDEGLDWSFRFSSSSEDEGKVQNDEGLDWSFRFSSSSEDEGKVQNDEGLDWSFRLSSSGIVTMTGGNMKLCSS